MRLSFIKHASLVFLFAAVVGSCSLMSDDLAPCPQGLEISFTYDYNVERADMFPDHVGGLTLYVFDMNGTLVRQQTENNSATAQPLADPLYRMRVEGLEPGRYQLLALANQRDQQQLLTASGTRYRWPSLQQGDGMNRLSVSLSVDSAPATDIKEMLDTLWYAPVNAPLEATVELDQMTPACVSLMRDTKRLHVSLHQLDHPEDCDIDDYDIQITDRNATLLYDNSLDPQNAEVTYHPFDTWNTYYERTDGSLTEETAHADLDFNRVMLRKAEDNPALLTIRHKGDDRIVAEVNLAEILAQGRGAYERDNYSAQEFLDRCYDYHLDFILVDGQWQYITLRIHTLPWAKRIQRTTI